MSQILKVSEWNKIQDEEIAKCNAERVKSGVIKLTSDEEDLYYPKFDYKRGYVMSGRYPIYKRRKCDLL